MNLNKESLENDITCQVCLEKFNETDKKPCSLRCGHSFCITCLKGMLDRNMATCPSDRKEFNNDVLNQINYPLMSLAKNLDSFLSNQSPSTAAINTAQPTKSEVKHAPVTNTKSELTSIPVVKKKPIILIEPSMSNFKIF